MKPKEISWNEYKSILKPEPGSESVTQDKSPQTDEGNEYYDVVYIVALEDELDHLLSAYSIDFSNYKTVNGLRYINFQKNIGDNTTINIAILKPCGKGLTSAASMVTQAILQWEPKLIVMTGICAAPKGKADFGDILIFESIYLHDEGKILPGKKQPDISQIPISRKVSEVCESVLGNKELLPEISRRWPEALTRREPLVAKKVVAASGAAVVADEEYIEQILDHNRGLSAIDMESYAIAHCSSRVNKGCDWLVVKSVQDNGDVEKKDKYRNYASFTSAIYSTYLVEEYFSDPLASTIDSAMGKSK